MENTEITTKFSEYIKKDKNLISPEEFPQTIDYVDIDMQEIKRWSE